MARSGCVSSMSRASAPAITSPLGVTATTLGTIPDRMRGPVSSITATRLLVVPRSMPIIGDLRPSPKSICRLDIRFQFLVYFAHQIRHIFPPVQRPADFIEQQTRRRSIVFFKQPGKRGIDFVAHSLKPLLSLYELRPRGIVSAPQLLERHVEFEYF